MQVAEYFCIRIKEIQIFSVVSIPGDGGKCALFSGIVEIITVIIRGEER